MKKILRVLAAVILVLGCATFCAADSMWDYGVVGPDGKGIHPMVTASESDESNKITIEGVALAGSHEILNPDYNETTNKFPQYTVFLQDDTACKGGMQAWTGMYVYQNVPMWNDLRSSAYINFQAGDRLRITGFLADMGRGKAVINNRGHIASLPMVWNVEILGHGTVPDPELIPSVSNCNYFDQTRIDGGERYQGRYVMLHGVQISGAAWGNNQSLALTDATGSVGVILSVMGDFSAYSQPEGKVNVVGIMDQEDNGTAPYTDGYRIWVKRFSDIATALNGCREVASHDAGERVALVNKVVSRVYSGYFYVQDPDRAGGVRIVSDRTFKPGDVVCVQGLVDSLDGEKVITPTYLSLSANAPKPVFVTSPTLWGEGGLDVDGLLVRVFAKVGTDQGNGTYSMTDDSGTKTIYMKTNGVEMPAQDTNVAITAVVSSLNGTPLLLLASKNDIQVIAQ